MAEPFIISLLSDVETPTSLFSKLEQYYPQAFLFESADGDKRMARFSLIGIDPILSVSLKDGAADVQFCHQERRQQISFQNPFDVLKQLKEDHLPDIGPLPRELEEIPLTAGWVGYLGYGMTRYFENIPQQALDVLNVPEAYLGLYDTVIVFDHLYRRIHFISHRERQAAQALGNRFKNLLEEETASVKPMKPLFYQEMSDDELFSGISHSVSKEAYCAAVEQGKQYIKEGQIFQIVLAQRFSLPVHCPALDVYRTAQAINPSPYAYFLKFPEFHYLGSSPEMFIRCRDGNMTLRALAGTRHRGQTCAEDEQLALELRANEKEMAEHRMLVDLGRNDVGRVCQAGSVSVGELAQVIRYSHVMHLATEINGILKPTTNGYDAVQSCFPRGTVSGAPKIRAMQLLSQLEPEQRGVYSGMVGYIDHRGDTDGAIAIRSALVKDGKAHVHAGAGVVYYSDTEAEYEETRNKAKSILKAIKLAERMSADDTVFA